MTTRAIAAACTLLLLLAACSGKSEEKAQPAAPTPSAAEAKADAAITNAVAQGGPQAVPKGVPVGKPAPIVANPNALPAMFQGKWGINPADCDISRGDTKGALEIKLDRIVFYESRATVTHLTKANEYKVTADMALTGEGQEWRTTETFAILNGGTALTRTTQKSEQSPSQTLRYQRC